MSSLKFIHLPNFTRTNWNGEYFHEYTVGVESMENDGTKFKTAETQNEAVYEEIFCAKSES